MDLGIALTHALFNVMLMFLAAVAINVSFFVIVWVFEVIEEIQKEITNTEK